MSKENVPSTTRALRIDYEDSEVEDEVEDGRKIGGVYIPPPPEAPSNVKNVGPRLIITQIVNVNFKSFSGEQVLGPFHWNFNRIIGSEDSGKCNVIDSMVFLFGYGERRMRYKQSCPLIHNPENRKNIKSCFVEVHFVKISDKGDQQYEVIANSDIVIGKTAIMDAPSVYTINGEIASFKQVVQLLKSHGFDFLHNNFLILQEDIDQIATMESKAQYENDTGMVEYLDNIIGTSKYKIPFKKLELRIQQLNRDREEKLRRLKESEKEKEALREEWIVGMKEEVSFLSEENDLFILKNKIHQYHLNKWTKKLKQNVAEITSLRNLLSELEVNIKASYEELTGKELQINSKNKELTVLKTKREQIKNSVVKAEKQLAQLKLDIANAETKKLKSSFTNNQFKHKELISQECQLSTNQGSIVEVGAVCQEVFNETPGKLNTLEGFDRAINNSGEVEVPFKKFRTESDAARDGIIKEDGQKLENITAHLNKPSSEIKDAISDETSAILITSDIGEKQAALEENLNKMTKELEDINGNVSAQDDILRKMKSEANDFTTKISSLKASKLNKDKKIKAIEKRIKEIEHEISSRKELLTALKLNAVPVNPDGTPKKILTYSVEDMELFDIIELESLHTQLNEQLDKRRNKVNLSAIQEFKNKMALVESHKKDFNEALALHNKVRNEFFEVRLTRQNAFMKGLMLINAKLKEMYQMMTSGCNGEFDVLGSDPYDDGVVFTIRRPSKPWTNITNLSGGEKTYHALALVFVLQHYRPSPVYVMDEIDAALDINDVPFLANYINENTVRAQFIVMTTKSDLSKLAGELFAIYKHNNCTRILQLDNQDENRRYYERDAWTDDSRTS